MIPFRKRGMYQALQNAMFGFGAIAGASFGGSIADSIGWRWCFLLQVPVSVLALVIGALVIKNPDIQFGLAPSESIWKTVDFLGSFLLVTAISIQLVGLSLGGNELPWSDGWVIGSLVGSVVLLVVFFVVEAKTKTIPIIPLRMLGRRLPVLNQIANVCAGLSAYAVGHPYHFLPPSPFRNDEADERTNSTCSCSRSSSKSCSSTPQQQLVHDLPFLL